MDRHPVDDSHSNMVKFIESSPAYQTEARYILNEVRNEKQLLSLSTDATLDSHTVIAEGTENLLFTSDTFSSSLIINLAEAHMKLDDARNLMQSLEAEDQVVTCRFDEIQQPYQETFNWIWDDKSPLLLTGLGATTQYSGFPGSLGPGNPLL